MIKATYFKREEFKCSCGCGFDAVDVELLAVLEELRGTSCQPVTITNACRCEKHNKAVGGVKNSQHVKGKAADINVKNQNPKFVAGYLDRKYPDRYGIGIYKTFVHIDVREKKARWEG